MASTRSSFFVDVTPLRESRGFRLLWTGQLANSVATQIASVAVPFQIYQLTDSTLAVGLVSIAQLGPLIVCGILGGAIADAGDRRKVLRSMQVLMGLTMIGLLVNGTLAEPSVAMIFVLSAVAAGISGIEGPARRASITSVVRRDRLPAAFALNQTLTQTAAVAGPALAGVLIGLLGIGAAYAINVGAMAFAIVNTSRMAPMPPIGGGTPFGLASAFEGVRHLRGQQVIQGAFLVDINAMVFGTPRALFPALGTGLFGGGATTVGLLHAAPGAGALLAALTTGWVGRIERQGRAVLAAVVVWGAAITAFGLVQWLPLALILLAVAGAADVVSAVFRSTIVQLAVPDRLRGRLSAINLVVVQGGPRLGDARAGAMAAATSAGPSIASGGILCLIGVVVLHRRLPEFSRWTLADAVEEIEEIEPDEIEPATG